MNSVHADCIHRMKILKLLTILSCEGDVPSDLSNRLFSRNKKSLMLASLELRRR